MLEATLEPRGTKAQPHQPSSGAGTTLRGDIEGLRAIAVGSVLLYHAGLAWTPGAFVGVDVFFVISGFLITSLMVREIRRDGRLRLGRFWARRARRLLPASTLVLLFSALVTLAWLPVTSRKDFGGDIVSAGLYVVNWRLGFREVDYLAEDVGASPVQHYWSLAVEEQFYVLWPLLIALVIALVRTRRRTALLVVIGGVTAASFAWALHYTAVQPGLAFFVSTTRAWELGMGALLAIAWPRLTQLPAPVRAALGWVGLSAIAFAVLTLDSAVAWPGTATLLPVLGTAAVILSGGEGASRRGPAGLLGIGPAVWVGGLSYSLYLWHWPLLIAAEGIWGDDLRVRQTMLVVLFSVLPAWLSHRYVENPIRHGARFASTPAALRLGGAATALAAVTGLAVIASFSLVETVPLASRAEAPGAAALSDPAFDDVDWAGVRTVERIRPRPLRSSSDIPSVYGDDCVVGITEDAFKACEFGDTASDRTVVLVGDSKAIQWFTAVERIASEAGWRLVVIAKSDCEFADVVRLGSGDKRNPSCAAWPARALAKVLELRPEVVLTTTRWTTALPEGGSTAADMTQQEMTDGLVRTWRQLVAEDIRVVPILDTPGPPGGAAGECVQANRENLPACGYALADRASTVGAINQLAAAREVPEVRPIDMTHVICPDGVTCPPVIGNVLVYRTGSHLSDSYAASAEGELSRQIHEATDGELGRR